MRNNPGTQVLTLLAHKGKHATSQDLCQTRARFKEAVVGNWQNRPFFGPLNHIGPLNLQLARHSPLWIEPLPRWTPGYQNSKLCHAEISTVATCSQGTVRKAGALLHHGHDLGANRTGCMISAVKAAKLLKKPRQCAACRE